VNHNPILLEEMGIEFPKMMACKITINELQGEVLEKYQKAEKSFSEMIPVDKGGKDLVRVIYELHDQSIAEYYTKNQIACKKGCDICCHQLVCCTALEMETIIDFIENLSGMEKTKILYHVRKESMKFFKAHKEVLASTKNWESIGEYLKKCAYGITPCPYLNTRERKCIIYPARPLICRMTRTKNPCGEMEQLKVLPQGINLYVDQIASAVIICEEKRQFGNVRLYPMAGWVITEPYGNFFL
jgi:Fe-S-cluster containining protein